MEGLITSKHNCPAYTHIPQSDQYFAVYQTALCMYATVVLHLNGTQLFIFKILHTSYFTLKVCMRIEIAKP